jgi:hypothetical protein
MFSNAIFLVAPASVETIRKDFIERDYRDDAVLWSADKKRWRVGNHTCKKLATDSALNTL